MTIAPSARIIRREGFIGAMVGDRQVLLDIDGGVYIGLDGIGSDIWQRLENPIAVDALCLTMTAAYAGDRAVIEADVMTFLERLRDLNLIEVAA